MAEAHQLLRLARMPIPPLWQFDHLLPPLRRAEDGQVKNIIIFLAKCNREVGVGWKVRYKNLVSLSFFQFLPIAHNAGTTNSTNNVELAIPPIVANASAYHSPVLSAATTIDSKPTIVVSEVMRIGRRRSAAPMIIASCLSIPLRRNWLM